MEKFSPNEVLTISTSIVEKISIEIFGSCDQSLREEVSAEFVRSYQQERCPVPDIGSLEPWFEAMVCAIVLHVADKFICNQINVEYVKSRFKTQSGEIKETIQKIFSEYGFSQESGERAAKKITDEIFKARP
ncbi:hypothetical protein [Methanosphaerula palustris]|uniref:hypothetical protein n=1 Tax=Methanosphaerula palustris TaxID=475088 RepID=UPI00064FCFB0|nr:hypothetical protein [Methanosphaerula palustris]